jgi:hypothetical protein
MGVMMRMSEQGSCSDGGLSDQLACKSTPEGAALTRLKLICLLALTACTGPDGGPINLPFGRLATPDEMTAFSQRRGSVEVIVKSQFDQIIADIDNGGGPVLTSAMDAAHIPVVDRPARIIQLQRDSGLLVGNPGALVSQLMLYGG